jgi:predicted RNase H-like HicB family nuclease
MRVPGVRSQFLPWGAANMYLTAIVQQEGDGFVALCPELDVASQGDTVEHAADNLREAVELFLAAADSAEVASRLKARVFVTHFEAHVGAA